MRIPLLSSRPTIPQPLESNLEALRESIAPRLAEAAEKTTALATQLAEEARDKGLPKIEAARDQAMTTVKTKVLPKVAKTLADAAAISEPARDEVKKRGEAAIAAIRGDVPARGPRRRRWPRAILLMGAGAVAGAAAGLMAGRRESSTPGLDAYAPPGGVDPYARPTAPVTMPTTTTASEAAAQPRADTTIDVTDEPAALSADGDTAAKRSAARKAPRRTDG